MYSRRKTPASVIAFGGILAALAIVIMSIGGMIPIATFVCPMLCAMLLQIVCTFAGKRIGWAWYGAVAILGMLLSPDKEAAGVFVFLGYYPIIKPAINKMPFPFLWKALFFNGSISVLYWILIHIMGLSDISAAFAEFGNWMLAVLLVLGNLTFFLLDRVLGMRKWNRGVHR